MHEIILGYQGEMSLKGLNRNQFESAMMKILRYRLKTVGKFKVYCTQSTFYMEPEEEDVDMDLAFDRVSKVFGLASLSRAVVCDKDFDTICQSAAGFLAPGPGVIDKEQSFHVFTSRHHYSHKKSVVQDTNYEFSLA